MKHFLVVILVFLFASCSRNEFQEPSEVLGYEGNPLTGNISTPTFNYKMGGSVELSVSDVSSDAVYTFFTFNDDQTVSTELEVSVEPDVIEKYTVDVPVSGCWCELGTIESIGNGVDIAFDIPNDVEFVYVRKRDRYGISFQKVELNAVRPLSRTVHFETHNKSGNKAVSEEDFSVLWGLNSNKDLFTIDLNFSQPYLDAIESNEGKDTKSDNITGPSIKQLVAFTGYTLKDAQPQDDTSVMLEAGSWTIAMDDNNTSFYTVSKDKVNGKGYPVYQYHLENMSEGNGQVSSGGEVVGYLPFSGVRLEVQEGFLYLSSNRTVIQMIPVDGEIVIIDEFAISGLDNQKGGDIVATDPPSSEDPKEWYLSSFGGLYKMDFDPEMGVVVNRKSAEKLAFTPTSLAYSKFNHPGSLWLADNYEKGAIYAMDRETGTYQRMYHTSHKINDLTCANGATDYVYEDAFPSDDRYYVVEFPSKYGWGSIVFEDMYPLMNDYDFNDLVLNFRYEVYYTQELKIHSMKLQFDVVDVNGASYKNGFGFSFDGVPDSWIKTVVYKNSKANGLFQRTSSGVETGNPVGDDAVFMVFDNQHDYRLGDSEITVDIIFTEAAQLENTGKNAANFYDGFDPFIFVDGNRDLEIHMPDKKPTSKSNQDNFLAFHDITPSEDLDYHDPEDLIPNVDKDYRGYQKIEDKYYHGFPWVLVLPHEFRYPLEEVPITVAYPMFKQWANLNEVLDDVDPDIDSEERYEDWYSDKSGYRVDEWIKNFK